MKGILVLGAGRSSGLLIDYLLKHLQLQDWQLVIGEMDPEPARRLIQGNERARVVELDATEKEQRRKCIQESDLVISMLPARLHFEVAKDCVELKRNLITPSYLSEELKILDQPAKEAGITIMNEVGVDPGIDHMSAMRVLDQLREQGATITHFESFTGGLVAPEYDDNPWGYKFTWNPRNVVLAGQGGTVKFIQEGNYKYIPYHRLFRRTEVIEIEDYGKFEGYANRDALRYREIYGLENIPTIYRGTLRRPGFCRAWDVFVQLGATDDSYEIEGSEHMTNREFINSFLAYNPTDSVELKLMHYMKLDQDNDIMEKLTWLDLFKAIPIGLKKASPAQILQHILQAKWKLGPQDKDMIVMWHKFGFRGDGEKEQFLQSSMVTLGDGPESTAMAKTVGLPVGITAKMILNGKIDLKGVQLPISKEVYEPVLSELEDFGIYFKESPLEHSSVI